MTNQGAMEERRRSTTHAMDDLYKGATVAGLVIHTLSHITSALPPHHHAFTMTNTVYPTAHTTQVSNPRLRLLNQLKSGQKGVMTFMAIPSVRMAQIVALCGFDVGTQRSIELTPRPSSLTANMATLVTTRCTTPSLPSRHWGLVLLFESGPRHPTSSNALSTLVLSEHIVWIQLTGLAA